jgi:hypothetical protein
MPILNAGVSVSVGPAAGTGALVTLPTVFPNGLRGMVGIRTGTAALVAGRLATITLAQPVVADMDLYIPTDPSVPPGAVNAGGVAGIEILLTPFQPAPPAGVTFLPVAQFSGGQVASWDLTVTGVLVPSTNYRWSWRVLT